MDELSAYVAFCALVEDILPADYYTNLEGRPRWRWAASSSLGFCFPREVNFAPP